MIRVSDGRGSVITVSDSPPVIVFALQINHVFTAKLAPGVCVQEYNNIYIWGCGLNYLSSLRVHCICIKWPGLA